MQPPQSPLVTAAAGHVTRLIGQTRWEPRWAWLIRRVGLNRGSRRERSIRDGIHWGGHTKVTWSTNLTFVV